MYSFIVLGLIPGTNIQIGFWAYLAIAVIATAIYFAIKYRVNHNSFEEMLSAHMPVEASQLHYRV